MKTNSNILIVDDDDVYLFLATHILEKIATDLVVETLPDGEQAVNYFKKCIALKMKAPEVLLLDLNMPFLDGWGFLDEYKKLRPNLNSKVYIYIVTSSNRQKDIDRAKEYEDLENYIVKPVSKEKLKDILVEVYNHN